MTAAVSHSPEPYEVPNGGLASFLTATVGDWSDEALNADNYYDVVKPTADQLAAFGREEDDRIAHVATGETVIPMAVFEEDPALKEALFSRMREMGIEPERYIVGNELNSINPVTGQPEFFLKKIFKGIKKAVKGVVKVFKKVAPIVLSIGLGMTPLGPIVGAALGSGIGTLIQGGSLKDAFKSALVGGAVAGIGSGISNVVKAQVPGGSAGGTFMEGVKGALPDIDKIQSTFSGAGGATAGPAGGVPTNIDMTPPVGGGPSNLAMTGPTNLNMTPVPGAAKAQLAQQAKAAAGGLPQGATMAGYQGTPLADDAVSSALGLKPATTAPSLASTAQTVTPAAQTASATGTPSLEGTGSSAPSGINATGLVTSGVQQTADRTFLQKVSDYMFRAGQSPAEINAAMASAKAETIRETLAQLKAQGITGQVAQQAALKAGEQAAQAAAPGLLAKYGPLAAAGLGIMGLTGGFEPPEMEPIGDMYPFNRESVPYPFAAPGSGYKPLPPPGAAKGGNIDHFPRKNGPIYGPGTETSDDIPAMLSDGEFVMTAKAVRGAGNGSRQAGMRKMYDMMRTFERSV